MIKACAFALSMLAVLTTAAQYQDSIIVQSKFERYSNSTGSMIRTETVWLGTTVNLSVALCRVTDTRRGVSDTALAIVQRSGPLFIPQDGSALIIDNVEIDSFILALIQYRDLTLGARPQSNIYYSYRTSNDIVVACGYPEGALAGWNIYLSKQYHFLKSDIPGTSTRLRKTELAGLCDLLSQVREVKF